jgi:hypothetical protein
MVVLSPREPRGYPVPKRIVRSPKPRRQTYRLRGGNLRIEWEGGSHGFTVGSYDRFELKHVVPLRAK